MTALAALETHVISPSTPLSCTADYTVYKEDGSHQVAQVFKNWDPFSSSTMTLPTAIAVSCDTFFYQLGYDFYKLPPSAGHPLQAWAAKFGIGRRTGRRHRTRERRAAADARMAQPDLHGEDRPQLARSTASGSPATRSS